MPDTRETVLRSNLIMPVNKPPFVAKSWMREADSITLDLEDSVTHGETADARKLLPESILTAGKTGSLVFVRINNSPEYTTDDLDACVRPGFTAS